MSFSDFFASNGLVLVSAAALGEALLILLLIARNQALRSRLHVAVRAAEDAARAATLAEPGGIDPEIVMGLIRGGKAPTLDAVHELMRQRESVSD